MELETGRFPFTKLDKKGKMINSIGAEPALTLTKTSLNMCMSGMCEAGAEAVPEISTSPLMGLKSWLALA